MAFGNSGFSFQPGSGDVRGGGAPTPLSPPATPIQTFNLNLPTREAQGQIAPQSLLQAQGATGTGIPNTQLLQMLLKLFTSQASPAGAMPPGLNPSGNDRAEPGPQDYAQPQGAVFGTPRVSPGDYGSQPHDVEAPSASYQPSGGKTDVTPQQPQPQPLPMGGGKFDGGGGFRDWLTNEAALNGRGGGVVSPLF